MTLPVDENVQNGVASSALSAGPQDEQMAGTDQTQDTSAPASQTDASQSSSFPTDPARTARGIAQHASLAIRTSNGKPADWARGILSGALSMMAGFGSEGEVAPGGSGAFEGIGAGVRGAIQRQRESKLFQQKLQAGDLDIMRAQVGLDTDRAALARATRENQLKAVDEDKAASEKFIANGWKPHPEAVNIPYEQMAQFHGPQFAHFQTGSTEAPDGTLKPLYTVLDRPQGGTEGITPEPDEWAKGVKFGFLPSDSTPHPIDDATWLNYRNQIQTAEHVDAQIQDELAQAGYNKAEAAAKHPITLTPEEGKALVYFGGVMSQLGKNATLIDGYHHVLAEAGQTKNGQLTPTAQLAQQHLTNLVAALGGPDGIEKLEDAQNRNITSEINTQLKTSVDAIKVDADKKKAILDSDSKQLLEIGKNIGDLTSKLAEAQTKGLTQIIFGGQTVSVKDAQARLSDLRSQEAQTAAKQLQDQKNLGDTVNSGSKVPKGYIVGYGPQGYGAYPPGTPNVKEQK